MIAGQSYSSTFQVKSPSGELFNADGLPTVEIYLDAVLTSVLVTVEHMSIGVYKYSFSVPSNWLSGQSVDIHLRVQADNRTVYTKKNYIIATPSTVTPEQLRDAVFTATVGSQ